MLNQRNLGLLAPWVFLVLACNSDDSSNGGGSTDASSADVPFTDAADSNTTPADGGHPEAKPPKDGSGGDEAEVPLDSGHPDTEAADVMETDSPSPPDAADEPTPEEDGHNPTQARFFRADSLWNTPISNEPVSFYDIPAIRSGCWHVNHEQYSNPVVFGKPEDPVVTIPAPGTWGWPATELKIHVPSGITGAQGTDASLTIVSDDIAYDFWQFRRSSDGAATVTAWAKAHIVTGTGWANPETNEGAGIRAGGTSGLAGEIFGNELTEGIPHALGLAVVVGTSGLAGPHRPPAIHGDGPMEGLRLGIPPETEKPGGLSLQGSNMWDALVTYGAWVADKADGDCPIIFNADPFSVDNNDVAALKNDLNAIKDHVRIIEYDYPYSY